MEDESFKSLKDFIRKKFPSKAKDLTANANDPGKLYIKINVI